MLHVNTNFSSTIHGRGNVMELTKISTELIKSQDEKRMVYLYNRLCQLGHESCVRCAVEIEIELHLPVVVCT